jgi:hypothetical protein
LVSPTGKKEKKEGTPKKIVAIVEEDYSNDDSSTEALKHRLDEIHGKDGHRSSAASHQSHGGRRSSNASRQSDQSVFSRDSNLSLDYQDTQRDELLNW